MRVRDEHMVSRLTVDGLLADPPLLHRDGAGATVSWQLSDEVLRFIDAHVSDSSRTLETGEGVSTILFALKRTHHICVSPDTDTIQRIQQYVADNDIPIDRVRFETGLSQHLLPRLEPRRLDLVLIDGGHGFPVPFVDWLYTAGWLAVGGILIVDDTQLWTGHVLKAFLLEEPGWELIEDFQPRTAIFEKSTAESHERHWCFQPFVVSRSTPHPGSRLLRNRLALRARRELGQAGKRLSSLRRRLLDKGPNHPRD